MPGTGVAMDLGDVRHLENAKRINTVMTEGQEKDGVSKHAIPLGTASGPTPFFKGRCTAPLGAVQPQGYWSETLLLRSPDQFLVQSYNLRLREGL